MTAAPDFSGGPPDPCSTVRDAVCTGLGLGGGPGPAFDIAAARYCAQVVEQLYKGKCIPAPIRHHIEALKSDSVHGSKTVAAQRELDYGNIIDTEAAAEILDCTTRYIRDIAADRLGGQRIAGRWMFSERVVRLYAASRRRIRP